MKKIIFLFIFFNLSLLSQESFYFCDISDTYCRTLTDKALAIWSLLELADQDVVSDYELFYDELCKAALVLCKEVQSITDQRYSFSDEQISSFHELFMLLYKKFTLLRTQQAYQEYEHAIDIILQYADHFLKVPAQINGDIEAS